jgi:hypothetical protein
MLSYSWGGMPRATLVFAALAIVLTWPQAVHLNSVSTHVDAWFNVWRLAWIAHALGTGSSVFDANIFSPEPNTFAYSDAMLLEGALGAPMLWAGVPVAVAYNLLLLGSFVFSGVAACFLVRQLTGSLFAGVVSGVIFAFAPYRFDHYGHFELLWSGWMPLAVLALYRAVEEERWRWGVAVGLLVALQTLSSIYYGVFLLPVLAGMAIVLWLRPPRRMRWRPLAGLAGGTVLAGAILVPYALPYQRASDRVGERAIEEVRFWSAGPAHYASATPENWLYGGMTGGAGRHEKRLFPGALALLLAALGLWRPFDRRRVAAAVGLLIALDLSFGTNGLIFSTLRDHVDVLRGLRVPARAGQVAILFVAVLAGYGAARLESWLRPRAHALTPAAVLLIVALVLEYATMPVALAAVPNVLPVSAWLAGQPRGAVAGFPMPTRRTLPGHDMEQMYQSTFHWQPLVNGHSGYDPPFRGVLLDAVELFPSDEGLAALRRLHTRYIVVYERWYGSAAYQRGVGALDQRADVVRLASFPDGEFQTAAYELRQ